MQTQVIDNKVAFTGTCTAKDAASALAFDLHTPRGAQRVALESFIHNKYNTAYGANISSFLPLLLSMNCSGDYQAALGLKPGACGAFFLEHYLQRPIEQEIAEQMSVPVSRNAIVEVGNLVSERAGSSPILFMVMAAALELAGYRWLAFTGTPQVKKLVERLNCQPVVLNEADPHCLGDNIEHWGRYYDTKPHVMALDLRKAVENSLQRAAVAMILEKFADTIHGLAQRLRDHRRVCGV